MITPVEIKQKATKKYPAFLAALLADAPFFPLIIPFRKPAARVDYMTLKAWVDQLMAGSKAERGYGYTLHLQTRETRRHGSQSIPQQIAFETEADFLKLIGKEKECRQFRADVALIRARLPQLEDWLHQQLWPRIIANAGTWPDLLAVCEWFIQNPRPNLYIREIPVDVHTKFIEENQAVLRSLFDALLPSDVINSDESSFERRFNLSFDEPTIRVRLLDPRLQARLKWPSPDLGIPLSHFAALELSGLRIFITENKMTFLTFPSLPNTTDNSMVIWGGGFKVVGLAGVSWLRDCPIRYWGDLDVQGFEILSGLRSHFPQTQSLLMDQATLDTFEHFAVTGKPSKIQQLAHLSEAEAQLHATLAKRKLRLEQERIPLSYVERKVQLCINRSQ